MATTRTRKAPPSLYSVHPGVAMVQKWIRDLPEKTGRSLEQWIDCIRTEGPPTEKEQREWLKQVHGVGTNTAWWLAERVAGTDPGLADSDPDHYLSAAPGYVDAMFSGIKADLRPLYDTLLRVCLAVGPEAKACPCKTIVPIYREHVIAQIKPTTRTRIDLGFALKDTEPTGRLLDTGGRAKKERITLRIPIHTMADIDGEVEHWLRAAYELDD